MMDISRGDKIVFKKLEDMPPSVLEGALLQFAQDASGMVMTVQHHENSILGLGFRCVYLTDDSDDTGALFALQICDDMIDHIIRYQENAQYEDSEDLLDFLGSFEVVP